MTAGHGAPHDGDPPARPARVDPPAAPQGGDPRAPPRDGDRRAPPRDGDPRAPPRDALPPRWPAYARTALRLLVLVAIAWAMHLLLGVVLEWTEAMPPGTGLAWRLGILGGVLVAYALLIAIPFVPGIEIGLSLVLMRGAEVALPVYLATCAGLALAYFAGRHVPYAWLTRVFLDLRMARAAAMVERVRPLSSTRRLALLRRALPRWLAALAVDYRYLLLALLINMPGSALIGGGGGICLLAGLTRLFAPRPTLATILLAVLPLPLLTWFWGPGILA